jgi:2-C-methyl-D-erythritol 4-phosphate cytidylyltransferase
MRCGAVIVAAGRSQRMGENKTMIPLAGRPVIVRVLDALDAVSRISAIVVVANEDNFGGLETMLGPLSYRVQSRLCLGGETRQESVRNGVNALPGNVDVVMIHDAARPLVTPDLIQNGIAAAEEFGAAIAAVPVTDTIKLVETGQTISRTLDRSQLYAAQTPQAFRRDWLQCAYARFDAEHADREFTDEAGMLEWAGFEVHVYPGSAENLKLTHPFDLMLAETVLAQRDRVAK